MLDMDQDMDMGMKPVYTVLSFISQLSFSGKAMFCNPGQGGYQEEGGADIMTAGH